MRGRSKRGVCVREREWESVCVSNCLIMNLNQHDSRGGWRGSQSRDSSARSHVGLLIERLSVKQQALTHILHFCSELKVLGDTTYNRWLKQRVEVAVGIACLKRWLSGPRVACRGSRWLKKSAKQHNWSLHTSLSHQWVLGDIDTQCVFLFSSLLHKLIVVAVIAE